MLRLSHVTTTATSTSKISEQFLKKSLPEGTSQSNATNATEKFLNHKYLTISM